MSLFILWFALFFILLFLVNSRMRTTWRFSLKCRNWGDSRQDSLAVSCCQKTQRQSCPFDWKKYWFVFEHIRICCVIQRKCTWQTSENDKETEVVFYDLCIKLYYRIRNTNWHLITSNSKMVSAWGKKWKLSKTTKKIRRIKRFFVILYDLQILLNARKWKAVKNYSLPYECNNELIFMS